MIAEEKKVQKINNHLISNEILELNKLIPLVVEFDDLLNQLEVSSIKDFESKINKKTKFTNAIVSSMAFGLESEYRRLLELQTLIDGKLSVSNLNDEKELKSEVIKAISEKHTTYYSTADLKLKKILEDIMNGYNALSLEQRQQIGFNMVNELIYNPFSSLKN
tara:strand:+ start:146 stop:634 length:489 start_codon:yes stop_codon:yes gene_type:complete